MEIIDFKRTLGKVAQHQEVGKRAIPMITISGDGKLCVQASEKKESSISARYVTVSESIAHAVSERFRKRHAKSLLECHASLSMLHLSLRKEQTAVRGFLEMFFL